MSPIFGAVLHMKNWQALGEAGRAARSKNWALGSLSFTVAVTVVAFVFPDSKAFDVGSRGAGLGLLIAWYMQDAKSQVGYVAARFGDNYPRRSWWPAFIYALLAIVACFAIVFAIAFTSDVFLGDA